MRRKSFMFSIMALSLLLSLSACWPEPEEKTTIVEGIVVNSGTKKPVEGALVSLLDGASFSSGPFGIDADLSSGKVNRVETDKNGAFRVEITGVYEAFLVVSKKRYSFEHIIEGSTQGNRPFTEGLHENIVLEMDAEAFFAPVLKSKVRVREGDWVSIEPSFYNDNGVYSRTGHIRECYGKDICDLYYLVLFSEYRPHISKGDKYLLYQLKYRRDSVAYEKIDSVYIKSFETYRDTIYY